MKRKFEAAETGLLYSGWTTSNTSIDGDVAAAAASVRARSRDLSLNCPYYREALNILTRNVIGWQGIRLQMRVIENYSRNGEVTFDELANRLIEEGFKNWCKKGVCTADGRLNFKQFQDIAFKTMMRDGEVFVRKYKGFANDFKYAVQLIEADYLDLQYNAVTSKGNLIKMGVEMNSFGRPVAYHFFTKNPNDFLPNVRQDIQRVRIPAEQIIHLFTPERPLQTRGFPWGIAGMQRVKMLEGYAEAELVAARAAAGKMGFIMSDRGDEYTGQEEAVTSEGEKVTITDADPGTIEQLPAGMTFKEYDPQHPVNAFDSFVKANQRDIATSMSMNYSILMNDYSDVNYNSLRAGNINQRDVYKDYQNHISEQLLTDIFEEFLLMALTIGKIALPLQKYDKFNSPAWRARGWMWVDPKKEAEANIMTVANNLKSESMVATEQGYEIEEIYEDLAREERLRKRYGLEKNLQTDFGFSKEEDKEDD